MFTGRKSIRRNPMGFSISEEGPGRFDVVDADGKVVASMGSRASAEKFIAIKSKQAGQLERGGATPISESDDELSPAPDARIHDQLPPLATSDRGGRPPFDGVIVRDYPSNKGHYTLVDADMDPVDYDGNKNHSSPYIGRVLATFGSSGGRSSDLVTKRARELNEMAGVPLSVKKAELIRHEDNRVMVYRLYRGPVPYGDRILSSESFRPGPRGDAVKRTYVMVNKNGLLLGAANGKTFERDHPQLDLEGTLKAFAQAVWAGKHRPDKTGRMAGPLDADVDEAREAAAFGETVRLFP